MNNYIFTFLHSFAFHSSLLDSVIIFFAEPFIYIFILFIILNLLWKDRILNDGFNLKYVYKKSKSITVIIASTILGYILANLLKILIHADRPFITLPNIYTLIPESGYAFPSGHSATIAAFAFAVFFKNKRLGYICFLAMLLIGVSRVVSGVHFPIDILGGYALGFLVAYLLKTR
jgi:undecaprenyl-diphosphatase